MEIRRAGGSGGTPRLKWIANGAFTGSLPAEYPDTTGAINPDAASARGALAVAAVRHNDVGLDTVESFSSRGPTVTRYLDKDGVRLATPDVRLKPDLAGADGVATTVDGPSGLDLNPFFGTSAAAPSAAGVAAAGLVGEAVAERGSAVRDPHGPARDDRLHVRGRAAGRRLRLGLPAGGRQARHGTRRFATRGGGRDRAGRARRRQRLVPQQRGAELERGRPRVAGGDTNCGPQTVATDGTVAFTCTATSAGGTTNQPVTIMRDTVPPSTPTFTGIRRGREAEEAAAKGRLPVDRRDIGHRFVRGRPALVEARQAQRSRATATDVSGLTSTSSLTYTFRPPAARRLAIPRTRASARC